MASKIPHTPSYICEHVFRAERPILLVSREDGDWMFMCGSGDHYDSELPRVVGLSHIIERDAALLEILDLLDNWEAERKDVHSPWVRKQIETR